MKIKVSQQSFNKALNIVSKIAAGARTTLPILNNVLIRASNKKITLTTTNLEIAAISFVAGVVESDGVITIPVKVLSEFVSNLPRSEDVLLEVKDSKVFIQAGQYKSTINGVAADEFPELPSIDNKKAVVFRSNVDDFKLAVGNVVGSITVNLGIGFALIAILAPHCIKGDKMFGVNGLIMLGVTVGLFIAALSGAISVVAGIILLIVFAVFTFIQIKYSKDKTEDAAEKPKQLRKTNGKEIALNVAFFVLGMVGFIFGADIVVTNATSVASMWGVSDYIIGLTIVAIGTSLPEFTITIIAVLKKENALSIGNLLGTNVFNVAVILPVAALVSGGIAVNQTTMFIHLPVAVAVAAIAIVPTLFTKRVQRWQGISLAGIYAGYLLFLISGG